MITPKRYRKKPVEVEAVQLTAGNAREIAPQWGGYVVADKWGNVSHIHIETLEGTMRAEIGDYIIRGVEGEFYPCKPTIFEKTYEEVTE